MRSLANLPIQTFLLLVQSFITIGVVVLLWLLQARLSDRPVFRWWAWAWTAHALHLGFAALAAPPTAQWSIVKATLVCLTTTVGLLPPVFLVYGSRTIGVARPLTRREHLAGALGALLVGLLTVIASIGAASPFAGYLARLTPHALAMSAALIYCGWLFTRRWRDTGSQGSLITAAICFAGGLSESGLGLAAAARVASVEPLQPVAVAVLAWRPVLFWVELITLYGTCLGLVLLSVEDYQRSQQALSENLALQAEIEDRRRAEQALLRSEHKFATAFRSSPCAMAITRFDDGRFVDVNDICVRQSGYERDQLIGRSANELGIWVDEADRAGVRAELEAHGRVATREVRWRARDGRVAIVLYSADTIEVDGRRCVLSVAEDITLRKQAEAQHRAILKAQPDWIFVMSKEGIFLDFHVKETDRLAAPPEVFLGRHTRDVLPPDVADALMQAFVTAQASDDTVTVEYSLPGDDGARRNFEARIVRCDAERLLAIVRDVTERHAAERQARELRSELAHVGRVTTLAALTGSLAHEINQPLTAVMTNAQAARRLMAAPVPDLAELRAALADIIADNQRAADVVRRLRTFLRKDTSEYAPVDLNDSIRDVLKVLQTDIASRRATLDLQLAEALPRVLGDRVQLQQVILNLVVNAFESMEEAPAEAGGVTLKTSNGDGQVTVAVVDSGVGLTDEQLPRMFEPFYTTKPAGMGLGLAICQTIMTAHDGVVGVERNAGRGATFSFSVPAVEATAESVAVEVTRRDS